MSEKDPPNPFEEIQRQLSELFKGSNVKISQGPIISNQAESEQTSTDSGKKNPSGNSETSEDPLECIRTFHLKPKEIRDYLDRYVIRQGDAKKVLSVSICDHYNHVRRSISNQKDRTEEYSKQNILLLGPTGVGKTYLIKNIARLIGVPFVKADATKFSETGYVGSDVEDLVRDLVRVADGNIELAEYGIIFVDEIDKIASEPGTGTKDVSGRGVQINLLKLMEDTEVNLFSPTDMMSQMQAVMEMQRGKKPSKKTINTRNILFIVSGAFDKLAESIKKRVITNEMGFGAALNNSDEDLSIYLKLAQTSDFMKYGFEPEFIGRIPVRVSCDSLSSEDLANILTSSEGSVLKQYRDDFLGYDIKFKIMPDAIKLIAEQASKEGTGARGLLTILERLFRDFKFELPSSAIKEFEVTTATIEAPKAYLKTLQEKHSHLQNDVWLADIKRFATEFKQKFGYTLEFNNPAEETLIHEAMEHDRSIQSLCEEKFKDFEHGFKIIEHNTGQTCFKVGKLAINNPDRELSKMVMRSVKKVQDKKEINKHSIPTD